MLLELNGANTESTVLQLSLAPKEIQLLHRTDFNCVMNNTAPGSKFLQWFVTAFKKSAPFAS